MLHPQQAPLPVELEARCRKCEGCLAHRRRLWTARAVDEIKWSNRTWFGTLTVSPDYRWLLKGKAEQRCLQRCREPFSKLSPSEQYMAIAEHLSKECTDWLKRVRKSAGVPLRYLLVFEAHKDGFPHVHILIHEPALPVRKALLESKWRYGFSQFRLVDQDQRAAVYVCKYLAKDALTRVRASVRYGQPRIEALTERIEEATRLFQKTKKAECGTQGPVPEETNESKKNTIF